VLGAVARAVARGGARWGQESLLWKGVIASRRARRDFAPVRRRGERGTRRPRVQERDGGSRAVACRRRCGEQQRSSAATHPPRRRRATGARVPCASTVLRWMGRGRKGLLRASRVAAACLGAVAPLRRDRT
jgi:hypothetical protein